MAIDSNHIPDIASGTVRGQWAALRNKLTPAIPWIVIAAYVVIAAAMLIGTTLTVVSIAGAISGLAGVIAFLTIGQGMIVATPTVARWIVVRLVAAVDLKDEHKRTISKISAIKFEVDPVEQRQRNQDDDRLRAGTRRKSH